MATRTGPAPGPAAAAQRQKFRGASSRASRVRGRRPRSASGGARLAALQRFADQRHPVIAEIHIGLVDEDGWRTEPAARHYFISIGLELILDRLLTDPCEEFRRVHADGLADFAQHRILRNILVAAPIGLEYRARKWHHLLPDPDAAAHGFDTVDRKYRRPHFHREAARGGPVHHAFLLVVYLGRNRLFPRSIDARVDGVEDAADQDRPPRNHGAEFLR